MYVLKQLREEMMREAWGFVELRWVRERRAKWHP
jgi:hypothetical protein